MSHRKHAAQREAKEATENAAANAGKTGWPPGMLQDDSRDLSRWFSSRPDAMLHAREAAQHIKGKP